MTATRVTQLVVEAATGGTGRSRDSQLVAEVATTGSGASRDSQLVVEVAISASPLSRNSQLVVEVAVPFAIVADEGADTRQLWPRGGENVPGGSTNATHLQGRPVAATAPTTGQGLGWTGTAWAPNSPAADATAIQGVPVSATSPTNGQVLVYNSTSGLYEPGTSVAGSYRKWEEEQTAASYNAASLLWDDASVLTAATALSIGTTTSVVNTTARKLIVHSQSAAAWRGYSWPFPAGVTGDFTMWTRINMAANGQNYSLAGIALRTHNDLTSGNYIDHYVGFNSDGGKGHYTSDIEYGTGLHNGFGGEFNLIRSMMPGTGMIVAWRRIGTNYFAEVSPDGVTYSRSGAIAAGTYLAGGCNYFVLEFYANNQIAGTWSYSFSPVYIVANGTMDIGTSRQIALTA